MGPQNDPQVLGENEAASCASLKGHEVGEVDEIDEVGEVDEVDEVDECEDVAESENPLESVWWCHKMN